MFYPQLSHPPWVVIYIVCKFCYSKQHQNEHPNLTLCLYNYEAVYARWFPRNGIYGFKKWAFSCTRISESVSISKRLWSRNQLVVPFCVLIFHSASSCNGNCLYTCYSSIFKWFHREKLTQDCELHEFWWILGWHVAVQPSAILEISDDFLFLLLQRRRVTFSIS